MAQNEPFPVACARESQDGLKEMVRTVEHSDQEPIRLQCGRAPVGDAAAKSRSQTLHLEGSNGAKTVVNLTVIRMPGSKTNFGLGCVGTGVFERTALYGQEERGAAFPYGHDRGHV